MSQENIESQGYGAQGRRVHDDLRGVIGVVVELDGKQGRIDGRRDGTVDEEDRGTDGCERAGPEGIGQVDHGQADEGQGRHLENADNPDVLVEPLDLRLRQLGTDADHGQGQEGLAGHIHDRPQEEVLGVPADVAGDEGRSQDIEQGHVEHNR